MSLERRDHTDNPAERSASVRPAVIDMRVVVATLAAVVVLVVVGDPPAAVIAASGGFVLSITHSWLRTRR